MTAVQRRRWQALAMLWLAGYAGLALSLRARTVHAHANLSHAVPPPYTTLQQAPERVTVWFTEPIAPGLSTMQVLNAQGERVDTGLSPVDQADPTIMSVALQPLPAGIFTVAWRNVSSIDGHQVQGTFVFSLSASPGGMPQATAPEPSWFQTPAEPVVRWLIFLSAVMLVGGLGFALLVSWLPLAERQSSGALPHMQQQMVSRTRQRMWVALGVLLTGSLGQLGLQAVGTTTRPLLANVWGSLVLVLLDTQWGYMWLWRIGILVILAVVLRRSTGMVHSKEAGEAPRVQWHWGLQVLTLGLGSGMLCTLSLASHGAATVHLRVAAIGADYLHLAAAAFWIGGLFHLASDVPYILRTLGRQERRALLVVLVPRFSRRGNPLCWHLDHYGTL